MVAARTYKIEMNNFMLRARVFDKIRGKECASGKGQELEENGYRSPSARREPAKRRAPLGEKGRFERTGDAVCNGGAGNSVRDLA